ncbi:MAG: phosphoribosylamine--glycine ligase [Pseudomonadota bacterium]|nr:phosphoribosylamine--glycine ligase [Rubrivivax sp.]NLZ42361.1 phosphoribosylamine--glycine ligase [Comamonadaceae bacterium]
MKVLVVGGGGREHALAWRLAQSARVQAVYVAPGNGGTALDPALRNLPLTGIEALADFAAAEKIALTVVGPEAPLAAGIVDRFRARGLRIFGPTRAAARLESSKAFAKEFMQRHGIPTALYASFDDAAAAHAHVERHGAPIVVKADGLAAGKGVVVAATPAEAHAAIDELLAPGAPGGARIVVEEFMAGEEASFIVLSDGRDVVPLASSQDHKRIFEGDRGPNTGGMGAYSPAPVVTPNVHARVMQEIIRPAIDGMAREGTPFTGFLYAGLMIDAQGRPRTVEFNCRLGDPEAQVLLMRLKSDLAELLAGAADGALGEPELQWDRRIALGVVMAAAGYPAAARSGDPITGLPAAAEDLQVFHAGSALHDGVLHTSGGRVLCVTALGDSARIAQGRALAAVRGIRFEGAQWRNDIGQRAIGRH